MVRKLFGTDGVRGKANTHPMTAEIALRLGAAAGVVLKSENGTRRVVIGKDTRNSSYMFESALTAGFTSTGMDVLLLGPVPTPRGRHADTIHARGCRRDDFRFSQRVCRQWNQVLRS